MNGDHTKSDGVKFIAWASTVLAFLGGSAMATTFLGDVIVATVTIVPDIFARGLAFGAGLAVVLDLLRNKVPHPVSVVATGSAPLWFRAVDGSFGSDFTGFCEQLRSGIQAGPGQWLGPTATFLFAVVTLVMATAATRWVLDTPWVTPPVPLAAPARGVQQAATADVQQAAEGEAGR